ncbi:MAG: hypothetical protein CME71_11515 [Halobacteriovorax sp.]|nr:hypothetical protein [Halobacteriovorax sp.]
MENNYWRKCSTCKKEINFNAIYQKCSVSTCRKNVYCSVTCWDVHNPIMNHKSSWAEEERAPSKEQAANEREPRRIIVSAPKSSTQGSSNDFPLDTLIVASKLKNYIKERHDMNTSANVMDKLSDLVRELSDQAVLRARQDGRKTLMDRDF